MVGEKEGGGVIYETCSKQNEIKEKKNRKEEKDQFIYSISCYTLRRFGHEEIL